ncbi:MAG: hypothetical protein L6R42_002684 [Xanthoria sp. 1 TBL-2021]|nr:MAG: hypothetical protein L6R42_002684 [Xanthoria sp. 1 TBL-2021]
MAAFATKALKRDDRRLIIHFDYDCFVSLLQDIFTFIRYFTLGCLIMLYAAVFEKEDPKLRYMPLAVQQKQIIVTCNYEARRQGLHKLQRVTEARKTCPNAVIVLGEDLTRFRNASKENYDFLKRFAWSGRAERLGFDEVFIDVTDMVDYNLEMLNPHSLQSSFFHLSRNDPTLGFGFDCSNIAGHVVPENHTGIDTAMDQDIGSLYMRLLLGSHLAQHLRHQLEEHQGYSSTVGISTSKLISKLIGNVNKPKGQTTLLPPYTAPDNGESNIASFLDEHDIGKIPGIGFKSAQKIRDHVLARPAAFDNGLVYGGTKENVKVRDVRLFPFMGVEVLEKLLGGSGSPKDIARRVWSLINGIDTSEVGRTREVPQQISIEDSYIRLDAMAEVERELKLLSRSLLTRIRIDLSCMEDHDDVPVEDEGTELATNGTPSSRQWLAYPKTLRLTTRPRPALNPDGTRSRTFNRISRSCDMPSLVLNLSDSIEDQSEVLVRETLIPLFQKLHPEKSEWDLSLMNLCAASISLTARSSRDGAGRDISKMFKMQERVLKDWKVEERDAAPVNIYSADLDEGLLEAVENEPLVATKETFGAVVANGKDEAIQETQENDNIWESDDEVPGLNYTCTMCGLAMPDFAITAHERFHDLPD